MPLGDGVGMNMGGLRSRVCVYAYIKSSQNKIIILVIYTETHNWSKCRKQEIVECLSLNMTLYQTSASKGSEITVEERVETF